MNNLSSKVPVFAELIIHISVLFSLLRKGGEVGYFITTHIYIYMYVYVRVC